jgi:propionate CoA-transferase
MYKKVVTAEEAVSHIPDNAFVGICGVNVAGTAMELIDAVVDRYQKEGHPKSIDFTNSGNNVYIKQLAVEGLAGVYYAGFPSMDFRNESGGFTENNIIPVFHLSQGIGSNIYRSQANHRPFLTKVGLGTYIDPRQSGGCANQKAKELAEKKPVVKLIEIEGEEYLHIDLPPITVAFIRATTSDTDGNLIDNEEAIKNEVLPLAMAAHNNGGIVIAQVKNVVEPGDIDAADVSVPGMLVDYVVKCTDVVKWHPQNMSPRGDEPGLAGHMRVAKETIPFEMWRPRGGSRMISARRATQEMWPGCICNIGVGIPMGITYIIAEEDVQDMYYQTIELGAIGGYTAGGIYFSTAFNAVAYLRHHEMFDFIDGGGLDVTFLGAAEIGEDGSVNVTRIKGNTIGSGGFVHIATNTKKVVFMCTHTAGGKDELANGSLKIIEQGKPTKFVKQAEQISFNGKEALKNGKEVIYMTERAVFRLADGKLTLIEYAPGLDIEKDIIGYMGFRPEISPDIKPMPDWCFDTEKKIGLKEKWEAVLSEKQAKAE